MLREQAVDGPQHALRVPVPELVEGVLDLRDAGMGYRVKRSHLTYAFAGVHGIARFDGRLEGGADPQRDGYAAAI